MPPKRASTALQSMMAQATMAQDAAERLKSIEAHLRFQTELARRAKDHDIARHYAWRPQSLDGLAGAQVGNVAIPFKLGGGGGGWVVSRIAVDVSQVDPTAVIGGNLQGFVSLDTPRASQSIETFTLTPFSDRLATDPAAANNVLMYADAFDNEIFVGAGRTLFVVVQSTNTVNAVRARLQIRRIVTHAEATVEEQADLMGTYVAPSDGRDAPYPQIDSPDDFLEDGFPDHLKDTTGEPASIPTSRHETPEQFGPMDKSINVEHTAESEYNPGEQMQEVPPDGSPLLPDAAKRLPPHLRPR